jgi:glycosyltransferase involved in cell wall biosynthesis
MRSGVFLESYARHFDVSLVVVPILGSTQDPTAIAFASALARRCELLPHHDIASPMIRLAARHRDRNSLRRALLQHTLPRECIYDADIVGKLIEERLKGETFSYLHVERLYLARLAPRWLGRMPSIVDIDDDEVTTRLRMAALYGAEGDVDQAELCAASAEKFRALEVTWVRQFTLSTLASRHDAARLVDRNPGSRVSVVPNAVRLPVEPRSEGPRPESRPIDILMVGTLNYYPNAEAAHYLCRHVRPHLVEAGWVPRIAIVGRQPVPMVKELAGIEGVEVHADVPDVAAFYADSSFVIVPLRAGGGSRIKILEALSFGLPVVSTAIGAEGLDLIDSEHLLIADGAEGLAAALLRLRRDRALTRSIGRQGQAFVRRRYSFEEVSKAVDRITGANLVAASCR